MSEKEYYTGSEGPFLFESTDTYEDLAVNVVPFYGPQVRMTEEPTESWHVATKLYADGLISGAAALNYWELDGSSDIQPKDKGGGLYYAVVPRADGEGNLGSSAKWWNALYCEASNFDTVGVTNSITLGSADNVIVFTTLDANYFVYIGDSTPADALFYIKKTGLIHAHVESLEFGTGAYAQTSDFTSGPLGKGWRIRDVDAEFQNIIARGIFRTAVFEKDTISAVNGIVLVSSADVLASDMTALDASTLTIKGETTFVVNEVIRLKDGTDDEWMLVTNAAAAPTYTVTRDLAGSYGANTNPIWTKGTAVVSMGQNGKGFVLIDASSANSPVIQVYKRNSTTYSDYTEVFRIGNLNGYLGIVTDLFGFGGGNYAGSQYVRYDPTNGMIIRGPLEVSDLKAGTITSKIITLAVSGGTGDVMLRAGKTDFDDPTTGFIIGIDDSDSDYPKFQIGNADDYFTFDPVDGANIQSRVRLKLVTSDPSASGEIGFVGSVLEIDDCDVTTGWAALATHRIAFTSGGTHAMTAGDAISGNTSGATATYQYVDITGGTWGGGDAAGYIYISGLTGNFQAEAIMHGGVDIATASGVQTALSGIAIEQYTTSVKEGSAAIRLTLPAGYLVYIAKTVASKDCSTYPFVKIWQKISHADISEAALWMGESSWYEDHEHFSLVTDWYDKLWDRSSDTVADMNAITKLAVHAKNSGASTQYLYFDYIRAMKPGQIKINMPDKVAQIFPKVYVGNYIGDGTTPRNILFPRKGTPAYVWIIRFDNDGHEPLFWLNLMSGYSFNANGTRFTTGILGAGDGYFTVGNSVKVNADTKIYHYMVVFED